MDEKVKLKLIKNNKKLQYKNDINLINYKFFNGRYIIYETKTKGKEYLAANDRLRYKGEFLNGERNGKGKEYVEYYNLIFEGEYLKEKKHGKGKEYFNNGILKFECENLNVNKWNSKGYDRNNNIVYELIEGKGTSKEYHEQNDNAKLIFEGEYLNGKINGKGKEYHLYESLLIFDGDYVNGKRWNDKIYDQYMNFVGELKDGKGFMKEFFDSGTLSFEGEYLNGERNGKGKEYDNNDRLFKFEGEYLDGKRNGKGKEYDADILIFEGVYLNNYKTKGKE